MRIYTRSEFMKLPPGTIFSSGEPFAFRDLLVKGESWECDFVQSSLIGIESFDSEQHADREYEMLEKGSSYPINKSFGREGLFDDKLLYLVYEDKDLVYLKNVISNSINKLP